MAGIKNFAELIALWDSASDLAEDLGVRPGTARMWASRGIPAEHWLKVLASAKARGVPGVTLELLATLAAARPRKDGRK